MSFAARVLVILHGGSALLLGAAVTLGYLAGRAAPWATLHFTSGFFIALVVGFTHAMTLFWFAGVGVSMRDLAGRAPRGAALLERAAAVRRRVAPPLGLALVSVMGAAILGGGSHTAMLPAWPHHALALVAFATNLAFNAMAIGAIRRYEGIARGLEEAVAPEPA